MELHVSGWGNSLGLRIPKAIAGLMGIRAGSKVTVQYRAGRLILSPRGAVTALKSLAKGLDLKKMVSGVTQRNRHHPSEEKAIPVGREIW